MAAAAAASERSPATWAKRLRELIGLELRRYCRHGARRIASPGAGPPGPGAHPGDPGGRRGGRRGGRARPEPVAAYLRAARVRCRGVRDAVPGVADVVQELA